MTEPLDVGRLVDCAAAYRTACDNTRDAWHKVIYGTVPNTAERKVAIREYRLALEAVQAARALLLDTARGCDHEIEPTAPNLSTYT